MHEVTDEEIDFILSDIAKRGIITEGVRDNILDHVCCIIENEMPEGADFTDFYMNTIAQFYQKELSEIEQETTDLTTFKYYYAMKRTLKITGVSAVVLIILGSILKIQHLPGAGVSLVLGFAIFSLVFVPLNIALTFRDNKERYNRLVMVLGLSTVLVGTIGLLFKVMHWPYGNVLFFSSLAIFGLIFIPTYFFTRYRNPETKFNTLINTVFMISAAGMLFALINIKSSHNVNDSWQLLDNYQVENAQKYKASNQRLYQQLSNDQDLEHLQQSTNQFISLVDEIRADLIQKANGNYDKNGKVALENPYNSQVVMNYFGQGDHQWSYNALLKAVEQYNKGVKELNHSHVLNELSLDNTEMNNTFVSIVLQELAAIQLQALSNEHAYLCLYQGLLAAK